MTSYALSTGSAEKSRADLLVVGVAEGAKGPVVVPGGESVAEAYGRRWPGLLGSLGVTGRADETVRVPTARTVSAPMLLLVGTGPRDRLDLEAVRRAAGVAGRHVGNAASVTVALPAHDADHVRAVAEGFIAGRYSYTGLRTGKPRRSDVAEVALLSEGARRQDCQSALEEARAVGELAALARDWTNTPPNLLRPDDFADAVAGLALRHRKSGVTAEVLDEDDLARLGCGGILAVSGGSAAPARLVRLTYSPEGAAKRIALVGKGVTFDSGGLTIKPPTSMPEEKSDMAGAASVAAATMAIAGLGLPVAVTAYLPMAENMVGASSYRPGDVVTTYGGRTVEVRNTDAEGRLILADAIAMAVEDDPDLLVTFATLTGPCVTALGDRVAGLFADDEPAGQLLAAAERTGELVHRLPFEDWLEPVTSESAIADVLQHNWVRFGAASWAAAFLKAFAADVPFAHLDVAGPAWNGSPAWGATPKGATGYGIRTLVELVRSQA